MNYKSKKSHQVCSKMYSTSRSVFTLVLHFLSLSLSPTKADLSVELKSFCGIWQFFLCLLAYHSHMLYNLSSPWPKHKALSASKRKEKLPLKKKKENPAFQCVCMKIWQLWALKNRELPHTPTYTVQRECTRLQPVRSLHAQAHHVHCTETQGPARGATVRRTKT